MVEIIVTAAAVVIAVVVGTVEVAIVVAGAVTTQSYNILLLANLSKLQLIFQFLQANCSIFISTVSL